jgi:hypothetical protein
MCCGGRGEQAADGGSNSRLVHGVAEAEGRRYHGSRLNGRGHSRIPPRTQERGFFGMSLGGGGAPDGEKQLDQDGGPEDVATF